MPDLLLTGPGGQELCCAPEQVSHLSRYHTPERLWLASTVQQRRDRAVLPHRLPEEVSVSDVRAAALTGLLLTVSVSDSRDGQSQVNKNRQSQSMSLWAV